MKELFRKTATKVSVWVGSAVVFLGAVFLVLVWAATGPIFHYSNTWQLVINTTTTIGTFLMIFLVQNTQNRDGRAVQLKLDELIRATRARDAFVDLEDLSDADLEGLDAEFRALHEKQLTSPTMKKLHASIAAAHRQHSVLETTVDTLGKINTFANKSRKL